MSLSRRGFLGSILGMAGAAVVLPKLDLLAQQFPLEAESLTGPVWLSAFHEAHHSAFLLFQREMSKRDISVSSKDVPSGRIGLLLPDGTLVKHQRSIQMEESLDRERFLEPAMTAMADRLAFDGVDRFGALPIGMPGCNYSGNIGPLRMIVQYDIMFDRLRTRFDVTGGTSSYGESLSRKYRANITKASIRRRLGQYPSPLRLTV